LWFAPINGPIGSRQNMVSTCNFAVNQNNHRNIHLVTSGIPTNFVDQIIQPGMAIIYRVKRSTDGFPANTILLGVRFSFPVNTLGSYDYYNKFKPIN